MSNSKKNVIRMARIGAVAAVYIVLTVCFMPLSYGMVQFRFSEILMLLCCFSPDCCVALTIGCMISNLFSDMAIIDVPFGTLATLVAAVLMYRTRRLLPSALICAAVNGIIIGAELRIMFGLPLALSMLSVAFGELVVVGVIGVPAFSKLKKNPWFVRGFITGASGGLHDK